MKFKDVCGRNLAIAALIAVGGLSPSLMAASGRAVSVAERMDGAGQVVVATARSVSASWRQNEHGDRLIVSRVLLDVQETLKGEPAAAVWMDVEGGTLDGFTLKVSDLPQVAPGERGVFFLDGAAPSVKTPHLRGQGILKLDEADAIKGTSLRLNDIRGVARARRN